MVDATVLYQNLPEPAKDITETLLGLSRMSRDVPETSRGPPGASRGCTRDVPRMSWGRQDIPWTSWGRYGDVPGTSPGRHWGSPGHFL